ncbi:MAG: hypothetical protein ABIQ95_07095 [Bdellovibrionia bacterium]
MKNFLRMSSLPLFMLLTSVSFSMNASADDKGHCTGKVTHCDQIPDGKCTNQTGCFPKAGEAKCIGIPLACGLILTPDHCGKQSGCTWSP